MNKKISTYLWSLGFCGVLLLTAPAWSQAQSGQWQEGQAQLEEHLPPGRAPTFYRERLADLGFAITSVNDRDPDYLEYEVVRGEQTYEVKLTLDEETRRVADVDVDWNIWKTEATQEALENQERVGGAAFAQPDYVLVITPLYVASEQDRSRMEQMTQELERLPVGRDREFYRRALERRGYEIAGTARQGERVQFRATKEDQEILLTVRFDEEDGRSTQVSAFPLLVTAEGQQEQERRGVSQARSSQRSARGSRAQRTEQELESLPVGRDEQFYRQALRERGYQITDTIPDGNQVRFEVEKNGVPMALVVNFVDEAADESFALHAIPIGRQQARASEG